MRNRFLHRLKLLIPVTLIASQSFASDAIIKCSVETAGGFNHTKKSHDLVRFNSDHDWRLIPFSKIPDNAIEWLSRSARFHFDGASLYPDSFAGDVEEQRIQYQQWMKDFDKPHNTNSESFAKNYDMSLGIRTTGLIFLRSTASDPELSESYMACRQKVYKNKDKPDWNHISCEGHNKQFHFKNGKFAYSYLGDWHIDPEIGSFSSSVLQFGTCKTFYD